MKLQLEKNWIIDENEIECMDCSIRNAVRIIKSQRRKILFLITMTLIINLNLIFAHGIN